jgi:DNA-binding transcriptional MerR regulator
MMTQIALACDEVQVYDNAIFMIHNAQGFASGDHHEMIARSKHLKSMSNMLAQLYVKKTGKSEDEITTMMDETTYMFGQQIIDEGFADSLIETDEEKDVALATQTGEINFNKSLEAMKEEGLSASQIKDELELCAKGCNLDSKEWSKTPSPQKEKIVNSNKGQTVKTKAELEAENAQLTTDLNTANTTIGTHEEAMEGKEAEIVALNAEIEKLKTTPVTDEQAVENAVASAKEEQSKALVQEFEGIMALAMEMNAPSDVAKDMAKCSTLEEARVVCQEAMVSNGVTFGGAGGSQGGETNNHGWGNIIKKKGE